MDKSYLKTATTTVTDVVDSETGEILETQTVHTKYMANTKEEFYLMYSSMVLILKGSSDVKMKLFAALLERYSKGQEFALSKSFKEIIAQEVDCQPRSFETAILFLVNNRIIVKVASGLYKINPRHVFQGSSRDRSGALKALIELDCKEC